MLHLAIDHGERATQLAAVRHPVLEGLADLVNSVVRWAMLVGTFLFVAIYSGWCLFFAIFAAKKVPLRGVLTRWLAVFLAIATALNLPLYVFSIASRQPALTSYRGHGFSVSFLLQAAIRLSGWALVIIFLLAVRRECAPESRTVEHALASP
jgi:hypothetical protein